MAFTLTALPFPKDSLGPTMSARTLEHHHEKHHAAYVKQLNELVADSKLANADLETIIRTTAKSLRQKEPGKDRKIFNNAAQVWNHDFFWESLAPNGGGTPPQPVAKRIETSFGSFENFRDKFIAAALDQFGSGWAWLIAKDGKLEIMTTHDADNVLTSDGLSADAHALWTCDLWEHAYYLDYQQERAQFVKAVIENIANWQFVGKRLALSDAGTPRNRVSMGAG